MVDLSGIVQYHGARYQGARQVSLTLFHFVELGGS
jgi:hypothetical protein